MTYQELAKEAHGNLLEAQEAFKINFDTGRYPKWFYDQSTELLRLYDENNEVYFRYIPNRHVFDED